MLFRSALFEQLLDKRPVPAATRRAGDGAMRRQQQRMAVRRQRRQIAGVACASGAVLSVPSFQPLLSALPPTGWFLFALAAVLLWPRKQDD